MKIPFLDLQRQSDELSSELSEAFNEVLRNGSYILDKKVVEFEKSWAGFCQAKGAVGVANGTDAITLALWASEAVVKGRGDEVITTPLSAAYTSLAILNAGAKPVFVDVDENTLTLDASRVEAAITDRTRAIVPVHLYGQTAQMDALRDIAKRHNLIIIEDAAQAHGAKFGGEPCGANTKAATFSFYPTKNLGALGDGGAIISNDEEFLAKVRLLRQGGHAGTLESGLEGRNSRLDEMQAAFLSVKLPKLNEWTKRRQELAQIYSARLSDLPRVRMLSVRNRGEHAFHLFVIRHPQREELREFLAAYSIETAIHYPFLLHRQKIFNDGNKLVALPVVERIFDEIVSLPLYPQMSVGEVETVCHAVADFETRFSTAKDRFVSFAAHD